MKKGLYAIAVAAATIFAAGCAREQAASVVAGQDAANVTFTVSAPGIATKAEISDGTLATKLIFAVYDEAGNYLADLSKTSEEDGPVTITSETAKTFKVTVPLVRDLSYQFLFVAKSANDNGFYTVSPADKKVAVDYTKLTANDDNADLFYAFTGVVLVNDAMNTNIALNRPVAQINVAVPDADLTGAAYSIKTDDFLSGLTFKQLYPEFNFFTGAVAGTPADVTIGQATRTTDKITVGGVQYNRIAMVYALVDKKNVDATINIKATDKNNVAHDIVREVPNVPIQANYRTNIIGNIFTSNMTFNVVVDNNFATTDYNVVISSQEELNEVIDAINNGDSTAPTSLTLTADVDGTVLDFSALNDPTPLPVIVSSPAAGETAKTVVVENLKTAQTGDAVGAVTVEEGAKLVLSNSNLTSTGANPRGLMVEKNAEVTVDGSTIDTHGSSYPRALQVNDKGAKVTVTNSTIKSGHYPVNLLGDSGTATIKFENTTIEGWCILNIWSSNNTIEIKNCTLKSVNDKPVASSNSFAAIVCNNNGTYAANDNNISIVDSDITVESTNGGNAQYLVSVRYYYTQAMYDAGESPQYLTGNMLTISGGNILGVNTNGNWYDNSTAASIVNTNYANNADISADSFIWNGEDLNAE